MRVRILISVKPSASGHPRILLPGTIAEVEDTLAAALVKAGYAAESEEALPAPPGPPVPPVRRVGPKKGK